MTERIRRAIAAGLLLCGGAAATTPEHVCVPAAGGGWACGDEDAPPAPAALPVASTSVPASAPPLLLIDPKRFRLDGQDSALAAAPAPAPAPAPPPPAEPAPAPEPAPEPYREPTERAVAVPVAQAAVATDGTRGQLGGNAEFATLSPDQYTVQLAAASSPAGFPALLQRLGVALPVWQLRVQRGDRQLWLLALGSFADAGSARAAAPAAVAGAFPKPVAQLQSELTSY